MVPPSHGSCLCGTSGEVRLSHHCSSMLHLVDHLLLSITSSTMDTSPTWGSLYTWVCACVNHITKYLGEVPTFKHECLSTALCLTTCIILHAIHSELHGSSITSSPCCDEWSSWKTQCWGFSLASSPGHSQIIVEDFLAYHGQGKCKAEHRVTASSLTVLVTLKHLTFT